MQNLRYLNRGNTIRNEEEDTTRFEAWKVGNHNQNNWKLIEIVCSLVCQYWAFHLWMWSEFWPQFFFWETFNSTIPLILTILMIAKIVSVMKSKPSPLCSEFPVFHCLEV